MSNNKITPTNFIATVYGELTPLNNSALSKARLKIFYKGLNRNGSYINDEVAEKLIATLPGTPVVGYFDADKDDFLGHEEKEKSRCYGFVPEAMNFSWEMSLDPDGVYRTYACTDIILWTGRYPIASKIVGKSHSMELNPDTVEGNWVETETDFYFEFTRAEFIGLCVLGKEYEPCFEGSSFYELRKGNIDANTNLKNDLKELFSLYKEMNNAEENPTGGQKMEDKEKELTSEELEKDKVTETVETEEVTEEVETNSELVDETNEEANESTEAPEATEVETENEENEQEIEEEEKEEENEEEESEEEVETEEEEGSEEIESEESKDDEFALLLEQKDAEIAQLKAELDELKNYKIQKVNEEKQAVLDSYSEKLTSEEVKNFTDKFDSYESALELKKDIALCLLDKLNENNDTEYSLVFTKNEKEQYSGAEAIIARHVRK